MLSSMGDPAEKPRRATYAEYAAVPANKTAMIVHGVLHVFPRPAPKHSFASSMLTGELTGPFGRGRGGPGGWWILDEPEVHLIHEEPINPDIAGWRKERMPALPETAYFTLAPDWVCEVLSKSTEDFDRDEKMPIYAEHGVRHVWLISPIEKTLEVYKLGKRGWGTPDVHRGDARVRVPPFDAIELELGALWAPSLPR
jgi:Putative restriction endonuclease